MDGIQYESLVPNKNLDVDKQVYLDALEWALENKENKNIAITGAYGAGKSSIINTYINRNCKESEVLKIAISTFKKESLNSEINNNHIDEKSPLLENVLEQQILQQMIHKINPNKIPNSRFININALSRKHVMLNICGFLFMALLTFLIVINNWVIDTYNLIRNNVYGVDNSVLILLGVIAVLWLYSYTIYRLIHVFRKMGVTKFGVGKTSIEFNFKDGSTVFNHYLDEIIYMFSKTDFKYVIFEDLDRFENVGIFERLRGLNDILNATQQTQGRDIRFIYALRDDMFSDENLSESIHNRTKFFDFIIPTVKFMHNSNAENLLIKKLAPVLSKGKLNEYLVMDIALFINDMRTLINICNEFEVFRKALKTSGITLNHLFAFIVYKNIYPNDYSNLLINKGFIYDVFHIKDKLILQCQDDISVLKQKIDSGFGSLIVAKEDIPMLFINYRKLLNHNIFINGHSFRHISVNNVGTGEILFNHLLQIANNSTFEIKDTSNNVIKQYSFEEFVVNENYDFNYLEAYTEFNSQKQNTIEKLEESITELKEKIEKIHTQSISSLLINENLDLGIDFTNKNLLYFLIRNNWLNESYEEYITYFIPGTLSDNDNKFLQSIRTGMPETSHLNLKNKEKVSNRIRLDDINTIAVLNFDFVSFLIGRKNNELNQQKLYKIINLIFDKNVETNIEFYWNLLEKLNSSSNSYSLVRNLFIACVNCGVNIWNDVISLGVSNEKKQKYVFKLLNSNLSNHLYLQSTDELTEFIANEMNVTELTINSSVESSLAVLRVKFQSIYDATQELVDLVIKLNAYKINLQNLAKIFGKNLINMEDIESKEGVFLYVSKNLEEFLENVILKQEIYNEDEDKFKKLLQEDISLDIKKSLIEKWSGYISKLTELDDVSLIPIFYYNVAFDLNWKNILYCHQIFEKENLEFIIYHLFRNEEKWKQFIENCSLTTQEELDSKEYNLLINLLLESKEMENIKLEEFIPLLHWKVEIKNPNEISCNVYKILVETGLLIWDEAVFAELYEIGDSKIQIEYLLNEFSDSKDSISGLNADNKLPWSIELINKLSEVSADIMYEYLINHVNKLNEGNFNEFLDLNVLGFSESLFNELFYEEHQEKLINYINYILDQDKDIEITNVLNLIKTNLVDWKAELFKRIQVVDENIAITYLIKHEESLEDILQEIDLNNELFKSILQRINSIKKKLLLINNYVMYGVEFDKDLANIILECIREDESVVYEIIASELIENQFLLLLDDEIDIIKVVMSYIKHFDYEEEAIYNLLSKLKNPFNRIKKGGGNGVVFVNNDDSHLLFDKLIDKKVISSYKERGTTVRVNNKQNR